MSLFFLDVAAGPVIIVAAIILLLIAGQIGRAHV